MLVFYLIIAIISLLMLLAVYAAINVLRIIFPHMRSAKDTALPSNQTMMQKIDDNGQRPKFRKHTLQFAIAFAGLIATFPFLLVGRAIG
ncbi:MAG: hypothetical protein AAF764_10970 [Pseudomonadota bacterium]